MESTDGELTGMSANCMRPYMHRAQQPLRGALGISRRLHSPLRGPQCSRCFHANTEIFLPLLCADIDLDGAKATVGRAAAAWNDCRW
jgi:hypothetical protein